MEQFRYSSLINDRNCDQARISNTNKSTNHKNKNDTNKNMYEYSYLNKKSKKNPPVQNVRTKKKKTKSSQDKNLLDVSERITDNSYSMNRILKEKPLKCKRNQIPYKSSEISEPAYFSQFDEQTFDSNDLPTASNDIYSSNDKAKLADLERKLSYQEGWSQYDQNGTMTYGIVPNDQMVHNNMMPFFSTKMGYGSNDLQNEAAMNYKNELFTGNLKSTWNTKKEVEPLFSPMANLSHMYGTPVWSEEEKSRFIPGRYHQGTKPFDDKKITPGLNLEANENGTHGYHSMYRALDKTVDELRVQPKITYEGRIIEGRKGQERPLQAPVISYRPESYKITTKKDLLPKNHDVAGPKSRDNFIMKETDRANQHFEYTGGAYTSHESVGKNIPEHMREKYKDSTKSTFVLPKPLQKFSKIETKFNPNLKSYDTSATIKDMTVNNDYIGHSNSQSNKTYTALMDIAKPTLKEQTSNIPNVPAHIMPNTMRGTIQPMDIANPTIKETTVENKLNPHAASFSSMQRVYNNDIARATMKEMSNEPITPMNAVNMTNIYANLMDNAKQTVKETTVEIPYQTTVTPINQNQRTANYTDIAKSTVKETTVETPYQTIFTPINQQQRAPDYQDIAKSTIKETTVQIPYQTLLTPINQQQRAPDYQDIAKQTVKETTVQIPYQTIFTPINQQQRAPDYQDIAKSTVKETTTGIQRQTMMTPINQQQRAPDHQDIMKSTTKETTVQIPYQTIFTPVNQQQRAVNYQDIAKATVKETTVTKPRQTIFTPVNQQQRAPDCQDIMKSTTKETTVNIPYHTMTTAVGQQQRAPNYTDFAKPTIKETTVTIPYNTNTTGIDQNKGRANTFNRTPLKTTMKEQTISIPHNTHAVAVGQSQRTPNPMDTAKSTIKETTVQIPLNTHAVAVGQSQRTPNPTDIAKHTIKETTVQIPNNTNTTAVNQSTGQAHAFNRTPLKSTVKETTIDNQHVGVVNNDISGKGYGYITEKMYARPTNKQFTCQEVYIQPLQGESKNRSYNDAYNAKIDDRKDLLHWYYEPTKCGADRGPDPDNMNVHLRDDNNNSVAPMIGYSVNNKLDRLKTNLQMKHFDNVNADRFMDPALLKQLESNPYNLSLHSN